MARKLSEAAQEIFQRNYLLLERIGTLPDLDLLAAYAIAVDEMDKAQEQIDKLGAVVRTAGNNVAQSPYLLIRDRARDTIERLGERLGIDQARALVPADGDLAEELDVLRVHVAMAAADGIKSRAAKLLGCSRFKLARFLLAHPEIEAAVTEIVEGLNDLADTKLIEQIKAGNLGAIIWWQRHHARDRGYGVYEGRGARSDASAAEPDPLDLSTLTDAELEQFHRLLAKAADARGDHGRAGEAVDGGDPGPVQKLPPVRH
jgi:hypothetical protein